jgi:hypothetical protein
MTSSGIEPATLHLSAQCLNHATAWARMINDELERMWKEAVITYFNVLSRHSPGGTRGDREPSVNILGPPGPRFEGSTSRIQDRTLIACATLLNPILFPSLSNRTLDLLLRKCLPWSRGTARLTYPSTRPHSPLISSSGDIYADCSHLLKLVHRSRIFLP